MKSADREGAIGIGVLLFVLTTTILPLYGLFGGVLLIVWILSEMRR